MAWYLLKLCHFFISISKVLDYPAYSCYMIIGTGDILRSLCEITQPGPLVNNRDVDCPIAESSPVIRQTLTSSYILVVFGADQPCQSQSDQNNESVGGIDPECLDL